MCEEDVPKLLETSLTPARRKKKNVNKPHLTNESTNNKANDEFVKTVSPSFEMPSLQYGDNHSVFFLCKASIVQLIRKAVSKSLKLWVLYLSHNLKPSCYPEHRRIYEMLSPESICPHQVGNV